MSRGLRNFAVTYLQHSWMQLRRERWKRSGEKVCPASEGRDAVLWSGRRKLGVELKAKLMPKNEKEGVS